MLLPAVLQQQHQPPPPPTGIVWRQDLSDPANFFADLAEANSFDPNNADPSTAGKFSRLDQVETMRSADGKLHFKLTYDGASSPTPGPDRVAEWKQTSNPFTNGTGPAAQQVTGFELIALSHPFDQFGGVSRIGVTSGRTAWYDCQPGTTNWWGAIAAWGKWTGAGAGGFPAFPATFSAVIGQLEVIVS